MLYFFKYFLVIMQQGNFNRCISAKNKISMMREIETKMKEYNLLLTILFER